MRTYENGERTDNPYAHTMAELERGMRKELSKTETTNRILYRMPIKRNGYWFFKLGYMLNGKVFKETTEGSTKLSKAIEKREERLTEIFGESRP